MATRLEHRRQTLRQLSDAAVTLFESEGPSVTIDRIAQHAGVSRRTVFRYVGTKEELAFIHPVLWFDTFDAALSAHAELPFPERLRASIHAIAEHIDADPEPPHRAFIVAAAHPQLASGFIRVFQRWIDRIAQSVLVEMDDGDPAAEFRARIVGSAVMGMVDAVVRQWLTSPPGTSFADSYDAAFAILAPLLAEVEGPQAGRPEVGGGDRASASISS